MQSNFFAFLMEHHNRNSIDMVFHHTILVLLSRRILIVEGYFLVFDAVENRLKCTHDVSLAAAAIVQGPYSLQDCSLVAVEFDIKDSYSLPNV